MSEPIIIVKAMEDNEAVAVFVARIIDAIAVAEDKNTLHALVEMKDQIKAIIIEMREVPNDPLNDEIIG